MPLVYIVVVTYNGRRFLEQCFRTLRATRYSNFRLVLVDNGSRPDTTDYARRDLPDVELLRLETNIGYAGAANAGIQHALAAGAHYVVVCNDDIQAIDPRWLAESVQLAETDSSVGMVGFRELSPTCTVVLPERIQASGEEYLVGFALLLRSEALRRVGLFDAVYGVLAEEDDLQVRIRRAGYRTLQANVPFLHHGGSTNARYTFRTAYLQMRNGLRFCLKHHGPLRALLRLARILDVACNPWPLSYDPDQVPHRRMRNHGNLAANMLLCCQAIVWNLLHWPQTLWIGYRERRMGREYGS